MSYYTYSDGNSFSYSTSIGKDDPAFNFIEAQSNKSGTIRTLLNDAVKVCNDLDDYTLLPESTRLRKYFNFVPEVPPEQVTQAMLARIDRAMADEVAMQRLTVIVRHTHLWRKYADHLVPTSCQQYAMGFIVHSADEVMSGDDADSPEIAFAVALKEFLYACQRGETEPYATAHRRLDRECITMATVLFDAWDIKVDDDMKLVRFTPHYANVARQVLSDLRDYYATSYGVTTDSLEMAYLHRLSLCKGPDLARPDSKGA